MWVAGSSCGVVMSGGAAEVVTFYRRYIKCQTFYYKMLSKLEIQHISNVAGKLTHDREAPAAQEESAW